MPDPRPTAGIVGHFVGEFIIRNGEFEERIGLDYRERPPIPSDSLRFSPVSRRFPPAAAQLHLPSSLRRFVAALPYSFLDLISLMVIRVRSR